VTAEKNISKAIYLRQGGKDFEATYPPPFRPLIQVGDTNMQPFRSDSVGLFFSSSSSS
jgi:hypothetical protein